MFHRTYSVFNLKRKMVNSIIIIVFCVEPFESSSTIFYFIFIIPFFCEIHLPHSLCARCSVPFTFYMCVFFCAVYLYRIVMRYFFCNLQYIKGEKRSRIADNAMHVYRQKKNEEEHI